MNTDPLPETETTVTKLQQIRNELAAANDPARITTLLDEMEKLLETKAQDLNES